MNKQQGTKYERRSTKCDSLKTEKFFNFRKVVFRTSYFVLIIIAIFLIGSAQTSCNIYKFNEAVVPDSIKTIKVNFIENRAPYVNPQLSPRLTDKLRQKIIGQTRLTQTNNDNADWVINGNISGYSFSTSGITSGNTGQKEATNRLTIGLTITVNDQKANKTTDYSVSRSFEFSASQTIQQAEATLGEEILRSLTDDIFNKIFSNW